MLAWEPGQQQPFAISKPDVHGERLAGNFINFLPQQDEEGGLLFEDGFVVFVKDETWRRVREALATGAPAMVPASQGKLAVEIVWVPELDPDYVDPGESHVPGGWGVFGGPISSTGPVQLKSVALLTLEDVLGRRVETGPLSDYIKAVTGAVEAHLGEPSNAPGQDLALECEVRPDGSRTFRFSVRPGEADGAIAGLREHLMELPPPEVVLGPIRFQLNIQLRGGSRANEPGTR
jgi:hypothetical protein